MYFYSGQDYNISSRRSREKHEVGVCLQFVTNKESDGWHPLTKEEFWPICPAVGDQFMLESYHNDEEVKTKYMKWCVSCRDILPSGPSADTMGGVVILKVERIGR